MVLAVAVPVFGWCSSPVLKKLWFECRTSLSRPTTYKAKEATRMSCVHDGDAATSTDGLMCNLLDFEVFEGGVDVVGDRVVGGGLGACLLSMY